MTHSAQQMLSRLATEGATGEFICRNEGAATHVHLHRGRIAWATSTGQPPVFTNYLVDRGQIDAETLRALVKDCRRTGKPLNRTLVEHGVAGEHLIRNAVGHQVWHALTTLGPAGTTVFVPRKTYNAYDLAFTLDYAELSSGKQRLSEGAPNTTEPRLSECAATVPGLQWVEHWRNTELRAHVGVAPWSVFSLARFATHSAPDLVVLRSEELTVIGAALDQAGDWIWCGVSGDTLLGSALLALKTTLSLARPAPENRTPAASALDAVVVANGTELSRATDSLFGATPELQALSLISESDAFHVLARRHHVSDASVEDGCRVAQQMLKFINSETTSPGFESISTASATSQVFGQVDDVRSTSSRWLQLDAAAPRGLGWARLQASAASNDRK